ncbi:MAG: T9SS type A sorting domain-containing protein [Saprospiraceae bacterium]
MNYLAFSGKISVNGFTSRINIDLTNQFSQTIAGSPNPFFQYLSVSEDGEVDWTVGLADDCTSGEPGINLDLPDGAFEVELFTIVVDGVPGDFVNFTGDNPIVTWVADVKDCNLYYCNGTMPVLGCTNPANLLIPFPSPAICNNPEKTVTFELEIIPPGTRLIQVKLNNLVSSQFVPKCDMVIHIQPQMNGINNLDLEPIEANGGPQIQLSKKRKNQDGSFDIYVLFTAFNPGPTTTAPMLTIVVSGQFNLSQGTNLICSMSPGRGVFSSMPQTICSLTGTTNTLTIPGYGACPNMINVTPTRYVGAGCTLGVKYTITHKAAAPIGLSDIKLLFAFKLTNNNNSPGTPTTTLPCQSCGSLSYNATADIWEYSYVQTTPLSLTTGAEVTVPFNLSIDCIEYYVIYAEATPISGSTCAMGVTFDLNQWPACDPSVQGSISIDNGSSITLAPVYKVTLESTSDPSYSMFTDEDCKQDYSFCPDPAKAPFQLRLETSSPNAYLCGVTTYDLVLISKHILNIAPLIGAKTLIAADASTPNPSSQGITPFDIVEIRKCILGIEPDFGQFGAPSWWYFRDDYTFNPLPLLFNPPYTGSNISAVPPNGLGSYGNFFAVKVGDVNHTCDCGMRPGGSEQAQPFLKASTSEIAHEANQVHIPVWSDAPFNLIAAQAGFRFDPALLSLKAVVPNPDLDILDHNFGTNNSAEGEIRFAWSSMDGQTILPMKGLLFTLQFEVKEKPEEPSGPLVWTSEDILQSLVYQEDGSEHPIRLHWEEKGRERSPSLGLVLSPNPFKERMTAFIFAENPVKATFWLSDGKRFISQQTVELKSGENTVELQTVASMQPGVYFLNIEADGQRLQRRVVKI